jgi:hypothetical protein
MKVAGHRSKNYPIIISVDDKVVYTGATERSLGYVTIQFKPTRGKSVKIALRGKSSNKDAFGEIVEIGRIADKESLVAKGNGLAIVEVEIYGPL